MLTFQQEKLLKFIIDYQKQNNVTPSFDEMKVGLDLKSKSGIHRIVSALEERGYIKKLNNRARAIEIIILTIIKSCTVFVGLVER